MSKTIAFIPARGGSKSIPLKNIKDFCGKPLIYWNLKALQDAKLVDEVYVATDSEKIKNVVVGFGFNKVQVYDRDSQNASNTSSTESVMLEFLEKQNFVADDIFILVQATSPLTQTSNFENGIRKYKESECDSLLSCVRIKSFFWTETGESFNYNYKKRPRRQDFEGMLMENGAFYINTVDNIKKHKNRLCGRIATYEMPEYTGVDLDEQVDWDVSEVLMKKYILK